MGFPLGGQDSPGNPDHPFRHIVQMTQGLLYMC